MTARIVFLVQVGVQGVPVGWLTAVGSILVLSGIGSVVWKAYIKDRGRGTVEGDTRPRDRISDSEATTKISPGVTVKCAPISVIDSQTQTLSDTDDTAAAGVIAAVPNQES